MVDVDEIARRCATAGLDLHAITSAGSYRSVGTTATGIYQPVVGDYDGNGVDDIVWYS